MIRNLDSATERFLNQLSLISRRLETAQLQITSGNRVNTVSDDPANVSSLLESRAQLDRAEQLRVDLGRFKTEIDTAEDSMQQAVKIMERVRVLALRGASSTATAPMRSALAEEAGVLLEHLVALANTSVEGRYIFSGDNDQTLPYTLDLSASPAVSPYAGAPATRHAPHPNGMTFAVSRSAQELFESAASGENVFAALDELRVALAANDEAAIRAAVPQVDSANVYLNQQLTFYGSAQNQINGAVDGVERKITRLRQQLSSLEDADLVAAILELNRAAADREAALSSRARLPRTSLFDYLG